jgi:hypothetical protein
MPNAKDIHPDTTYIKTFIVGDSGTGKSIFASTFPTPIFLFNFDKSILSYKGLDVDYEDYTQDAQGWVKFEKDFRELKKQVKENTFKYKSIVIDSTTSWTDLAMERAMQLDPKRSATNGPLWNVHYAMVKNLMEGFIRQLLEFPCNIVVIGHLTKHLDSETGAVIGIEPMLTGQLSVKVPSYFDEVYYSITKTIGGKTEFKLLTLAKGFLKARSRLSGIKQILPQEVNNNYTELMTMIRKGQ